MSVVSPDTLATVAGGLGGATITGVLGWFGRAWFGRDRDGAYWQRRVIEADKLNEELYVRNQRLHEQLERALHSQDAVVRTAEAARTEVARVVSGSDSGPAEEPAANAT